MKRFLGLASCSTVLFGLTFAVEASAQSVAPAEAPSSGSPAGEPDATAAPASTDPSSPAPTSEKEEEPAPAGEADPADAQAPAAQPPDAQSPAAAPEALPAAVPGPLLLEVEGAFSEEEKDALKAALIAELGCLVLEPDEKAAFAFRGVVRVRADAASRALTIRFEDEAHEVSERTLESPPSSEGRERTIVFVVGSLARSALPKDAAAEEHAPEPPLEKQFAHASLYYPVATNYGKPNIHTHLGFNLVYGRVGFLEGFSLGTVQVATKGVQGLELALGANVSLGDVEGFQTAFAVNAAENLDGAQLALGVNLAKDVDGAQIGLVNHAGKVRGVQLGLVNVSDEIEGVPIGLVSVSKKYGGVHPIAWYSNHSYVNIGLKFATRYTYTFVNLAWNTDDYMLGPGFGIGGTLPVWQEKLFVDLDVSETMLMPEGGAPERELARNSQYLSRVRLLARYQFLKHLGVFAGGGLVVKVERDWDQYSPSYGEMAPNALGEVSAGAQF